MKKIFFKAKCWFIDLRFFYFEKKEKFINSIINKYNREILKDLSKELKADSYHYIAKENVGNQAVLFPLETVLRVIREVYGYKCKLRLYGVEVKTQEDIIEINLTSRRPGFLIGKGGEKIDKFQDLCKVIFGRKISVNIIEVKYDINEPIRNY